MPKTQPVKATSTELTFAEIQDLAQAWIDDGEIRQFSVRTLDERKRITGKSLWFLKDRELSTCGTRELRLFLAYISRGHNEAGGWGMTAQRPHSRALFRLCNVQPFVHYTVLAGPAENHSASDRGGELLLSVVSIYYPG